ncbi:MAG: hypothetical protein AB7U98_00285 [Candidatus Nitrosocosmicus sp.]
MNKILTQKVSIATFALSFLLISNMAVLHGNSFQKAFSQPSEAVDTFSAAGYTGQNVVLPPGIPQVPTSDNMSRAPIGSVIGGNWSFSVNEGQLEDFKWEATAYTLTGEVNGTFAIESVKDNATAIGTFTVDEANNLTAVGSSTDNDESRAIQLIGNHTSIESTANIIIDGEPVWTDVPIALYLLNGNIVSMTVSPNQTNNSFPVPLYGIVTSLNS